MRAGFEGVWLRSTLVECAIDTVFHLAGQTIVGVANREPVATFETDPFEAMAQRFFNRLGASFLDRTICAEAGAAEQVLDVVLALALRR